MKRLTKPSPALQKIFSLQCEICKALGHPARLAIVDLLDDRETAATELLEALGTSKANLSKHMTLLTHAGIIQARRSGRQVFYQLTDPEIHKACAIMRSILYRRLKESQRLASAIGSRSSR